MGLSQGALVARSGIPLNHIRQWEYGMDQPKFFALLLLARGLDVSLSVFDDIVVTVTGTAPKGPALRPRGRPRKAEPGQEKGKRKRKG